MDKMKAMDNKKWFINSVVILIGLIIAVALITAVVDPYFHFHKPFIKYRLYQERYINDGIGKHFDYQALISGNSLSQNFKASQWEEITGFNTVKLPYSGAGYGELWGNVSRILEKKGDVCQVVMAMDTDDILKKYDYVRYTDLPEYLYDESVINDIYYLLNKEILYRGTMFNLLMTLRGQESTSFDEYAAWDRGASRESALKSLTAVYSLEDIRFKEYNEVWKQQVVENISMNIIPVLDANPEVEFIIIWPPCSIAKWASRWNYGDIELYIGGMDTALDLLLPYDNVKLYGFAGDIEDILNLDMYSDEIHYDAAYNAHMLDCISRGEYLITLDNKEDFIIKLRDFLLKFDYSSLLS